MLTRNAQREYTEKVRCAGNTRRATVKKMCACALEYFQTGVTGGTGPNNIGLLARIWGEATVSGTTTLDDGSGVTVTVDTSGLTTPPADGEYVTLTGISSIAPGGDRLLLAID